MKTKSLLLTLLSAAFITLNCFAQEQAYKISLAEWSLNRTLRKGTITNMDFPRIAKETYGLDPVEYVSTFFRDKTEDTEYLTKLKIISDSGFKGYIDVEYEGSKLSEEEGIKATIALLRKVIEPYNK